MWYERERITKMVDSCHNVSDDCSFEWVEHYYTVSRVVHSMSLIYMFVEKPRLISRTNLLKGFDAFESVAHCIDPAPHTYFTQ